MSNMSEELTLQSRPQDTQIPPAPAALDQPLVTHLRSSGRRGATPSVGALGVLASSILAACGGGGSEGSGAGAPVNYPKAESDAEAARFLQQAQFSSTPTEIAQLRASSYVEWMQQQFAMPLNSGWDWLEERQYGAEADASKVVYEMDIADFMLWNQLFTAPDAMRKRMALALSEFFVVSAQGLEIDFRGYAITAYWDLLNKHAFGNFRNLLEDITLNPAMGYFLNTKGNRKEDPAKGRVPDENYAREVMQLFTIGLHELNIDGTEKLDAQGRKIETYDSDDVSQLARVFTGYDFDRRYFGLEPASFNYEVFHREYARQPMFLDASKHSNLSVSFLNVSIPANTPGAQALKMALDGLFNHPNVGPFFARQMIQRLVTSNPSPGYVARVASTFNNNGAGVRGDMKAVWAAILLDDEARGARSLSNPGFGKVREPMLRFVQWGRSFGLKSITGSWKLRQLGDTAWALGQSPLRPSSVFNFFRPGYVPAGTELAKSGATAPEFQIVNETTVGGYINYMEGVIRNGLKTHNPTDKLPVWTNNTLDLVTDYSTELGFIDNSADPSDADATRIAQRMVAHLNLRLCAGQMSSATALEIQNALKAAMLVKKIKAVTDEKIRRDWVAAGILMTMVSPDYLVQK